MDSIYKYKPPIIADQVEKGNSYLPFKFGIDNKAYCNSGAGIKIAIIGSGTPQHKDIEANNVSEIAMNGNTDLSDQYGFSTMITGIIAANSTDGVQGFAPLSEILSVKITNKNNMIDPRALSAAILWATVRESDIIVVPTLGNSFDDNISLAIKKANDMRVVVIGFRPLKLDKTSVTYPEMFFIKPPFKKQSSHQNISMYSKNVLSIRTSSKPLYTTWLDNKYAYPPPYIECLGIMSGLAALVIPMLKTKAERPLPTDTIKHIVSLSK